MRADYFTTVVVETTCDACAEPADVTVCARGERLEIVAVSMGCEDGAGFIDRDEAIDEAAVVLGERIESAAHAAMTEGL